MEGRDKFNEFLESEDFEFVLELNWEVGGRMSLELNLFEGLLEGDGNRDEDGWEEELVVLWDDASPGCSMDAILYKLKKGEFLKFAQAE